MEEKMTVDKMKKEDLELLSNKDITNLILEESKKPLNTADLFKKILMNKYLKILKFKFLVL